MQTKEISWKVANAARYMRQAVEEEDLELDSTELTIAARLEAHLEYYYQHGLNFENPGRLLGLDDLKEDEKENYILSYSEEEEAIDYAVYLIGLELRDEAISHAVDSVCDKYEKLDKLVYSSNIIAELMAAKGKISLRYQPLQVRNIK